MSLNIKDPEVHRLAQELSRETGESMTQVVKEALLERKARIERRKQKASIDELKTLVQEFRSLMKEPIGDHGELLYDEYGLPK
jgi:antitoxin VapB